jgi:thiol-disulfide isomerase/thioredoxin
MTAVNRSCVLVLYVFLCIFARSAAAAAAEDPWLQRSGDDVRVVLYFFWTSSCPHCQVARPFVQTLAQENDWIELRSLEVVDSDENRRLYLNLAATLGEKARSVPAFVFCAEMITGFDHADGVGAFLRKRLLACREQASSGMVGMGDPAPVMVPVFGEMDLDEWSLPMLTLTLAALDSINPCAMFVLLFLLSLLVHAKSRARMLMVGAMFVTISGLAYFAFMAAWLNLFLIVGQLSLITFAAGLLAIAFGAVNVKDYFRPDLAVSLSIPESAKPRLFQRMRQLVGADRLAPLIGGTLMLAVVANAYELLCTAGFPMVFTRALTLHDLPTSSYYLYLIAYNVIYVLPLFLIVVLFVISLGRRKLTEAEGRSLKLLSGLMMLGLGIVLVSAPALLSNVLVAIGLLGIAITVTVVMRKLPLRGW